MLDNSYARSARWLLSVVVALLVLQVSSVGSASPARQYWIEEFAATLSVSEDGTLDVTEDIRFYFDGQYQGIYRDIPLRYSDNLGFNYRLRFNLVSVTDESGNSLRHESEGTGGGRRRITVWVPGANNAARRVRIHYRVERALRFFPEHDELYWNVTGTEWGVPINSARARVILPRGLENAPRVVAYVGQYGSRGDSWTARQVSGNEIEVVADRELAYGEGLTVVVGWDKGLVPEPTAVDRAGWMLADNWPLGLPLFAFLFMFGLWRSFGRDPDIGRSVMPMYHPPEQMSPAEIGTLIDEKVDQRDIVATVVDLAVRGYLRIEEDVEDGWFGDDVTTTFVRLKPADEDLKPHEREVYDGIFESGDRATVEDLENEFYSRLGTIRGHVYDRLVSAGYFRSSPQTTRRVWLVMGILVCVFSIPMGAIFGSPALAIGGGISGVIVMIFSAFMPARTLQGRHKWFEIKGFEEFLGRTEGDRLREAEVDLEKFENFLPFAMALGVAEQWGRAFEGMLKEAPDWYSTTAAHRFSAVHFSNRMSTVSRSMGTAMATAPRSSSSGSSGFSSGGGFSGGGFGGGGGGAF